MRILNIRFKNLNSLVGEWEIDLTHPAYSADGIFAIVGPTGAGKTTILDAMCLALYGRTPRLARIGKNSNELMSRHTGECFAEVVFETQSGIFRCHWSQHRSRRKSDGDLQNPKHEISEAETGKIIESKLRAVSEKIEQVSGMDFDRFTRSMLLAQGGFSVFLQAAADERAPILEQITGTEIYSQISVRVHEKRVDERKKLELLTSGLSGMQLLSTEEELHLNESLIKKRTTETGLIAEVEKNRKALGWLEIIAQLKLELDRLNKQKQDLSDLQVAFKHDAEKLKLAKRALELSGEYASLNAMRGEQAGEKKQLTDFQKLLPDHRAEVSKVEQTLKSALDDLVQKKQEQKEQRVVIQEIRELDIKISEKESLLSAAEITLKEREKTLADIHEKLVVSRHNLSKKTTTFKELTTQLENTQADEGLIEHLTGIRNRFDVFSDLDRRKRDKDDKISDANQLSVETYRSWVEQTEKLDVLKIEQAKSQRSYDELLLQRKTSLNSRDISNWRTDLSALKDQKIILEKASQASLTLVKLKQYLIELSEKYSVVSTERSSLNVAIEKQTDQQATYERELQLLETQLSLLKKIESYEEARDQLQDGESCPLCGAENHPFAEGNIPKPGKAATELNSVKTKLRADSEALSLLKIELAKMQKDLDQLIVRQNETKDRITSENLVLQNSLDDLGLDCADEATISNTLNNMLQKNSRVFELTENTVKAIDDNENKILTAQKLLDQASDIVTKTERDVHTLSHQKESGDKTVVRLKSEFSELSNQLLSIEQQTLNDISAYDIKRLSIDSLDNIQQQLTARRDQRLSLKQELAEYEKQISALELETKHQTDNEHNAKIAQEKQKIATCALQQERDKLTQERKISFADKSPDNEEALSLIAVEKAEETLTNTQQLFDQVKRKLNDLETQISTLEKSLLTRGNNLLDKEVMFNKLLNSSDFSDEKNYLSACLTEDERTHLIKQEQQLITEHATLHGQYDDRKIRLDMEQKKLVTEKNTESLKETLDSQSTNLRELQQELGGIQQKLSNNESVRLKQQKKIAAISAQEKECTRWDTLHLLIGSADGKKYRNFAQGLTFEMMVSHANRQLRKMTDRYLLIRDHIHPLELNVIDSYQAGEIRSTKNLSGGEGFIVSLALALGLSNMASKNVRVDSLFLDEGFGTLDEDALDIALETLAGLQQEGKLIGVISHLSMLKDRISTQINISPKTGGQSTISGPGCRAV